MEVRRIPMPSTAHCPRHPISRSRPLSLPPSAPPGIALPPLVHALHHAPSAQPISRSRPSAVHRPRTRYRAPAPCPRPPPRTRSRPYPVRTPEPSAHPISRPRAPFSLLKRFRQDTARYRAPCVGALNENPTPEGFSGKKY